MGELLVSGRVNIVTVGNQSIYFYKWNLSFKLHDFHWGFKCLGRAPDITDILMIFNVKGDNFFFGFSRWHFASWNGHLKKPPGLRVVEAQCFLMADGYPGYPCYPSDETWGSVTLCKTFREIAPFTFQEIGYTLPETNVAPGNGWLEDKFSFRTAHFQGLC